MRTEENVIENNSIIPTPWTPIELGSALVGWWQADRGITLNGSVISEWADQSGLGHHLTQATLAKMPSYLATGSPTGEPMVVFDGLNNWMATAAFTLNQPEHVFFACKHYKPITSEAWEVTGYLCDGIPINSMAFNITKLDPDTLNTYAGASGPTISAPKETWEVIDALYNGAASKVGLNGGTHVVGDVGSGNASGFTVGSPGSTADNYQGKFDVVSIILANRELTSFERASAVNYFKELVGIV